MEKNMLSFQKNTPQVALSTCICEYLIGQKQIPENHKAENRGNFKAKGYD